MLEKRELDSAEMLDDLGEGASQDPHQFERGVGFRGAPRVQLLSYLRKYILLSKQASPISPESLA